MARSAELPIKPEVFAANRRILARRFPHLAALVDSWSEGYLLESVRAYPSRSGLPTMAVETAAGTVHVHSTFQPMVEADRWAKDPLDREWDFAVVFGMGLGYHLEALLTGRPAGRLVVIEPRADVFCAAVSVRDQQRLLSHPYLELIVGDDPVAAAQALCQTHFKDLLDQSSLLMWPAAVRYAPDFWKTFDSHLVEMLRVVRSDVLTRQKYHDRWLSNFFQNVHLALGDPGVSALRERLAGRPAVIASAGPSLEKNVSFLHRAKGKAIIIAAGSAINPLLKHGIKPDLLVSFDAGKGNYRHFRNLCTPSLPLVYIPTIFPQILEEYQGPRFTAAMDSFPFVGWVFDRFGKEKGVLTSGPSVANVAWDLANMLGLDPIILVGQDLALTGGKTHAEGALHARTVTLESADGRSSFITTEGVDGAPVFTTPAMYSMKVWFERRLANAPAARLTIDATEGGAKIAGTTIMPLKQALETYCREEFNPHQMILAVHHQESRRLRDDGVEQRLRDIYHDLGKQVVSVEGITKDGLLDANRLLRESTTRRLTEQRFSEAVTRLTRHHARLTAISLYQLFIEPLNVHVNRSVAWRMQARWEKKTDIFSKGEEIARQFVTLFSSARDTAKNIERLLEEQTNLMSPAYNNSSAGSS